MRKEIAMTLRKTFSAVAAVAAVMIAGGAAQAQNCMEVLDRTPDAGRFVAALTRTGQTALLRGSGPFTILAPANEAVSKTPQNIRNDVFGQGPTEDMDPYLAPAVVSAHI